MTRSKNKISRAIAGFTLFEILITLTVSAILAVVLIQFVSGQTERSWRPIQNLNQTLALQSVMDQITSDYRNLLLTDGTPLKTLQVNIGNDDYGISGTDIKAISYCFDFTESRGEGTNHPCEHDFDPDTDDDTLLRVTLTYGDHNLTSLFAR